MTKPRTTRSRRPPAPTPAQAFADSLGEARQSAQQWYDEGRRLAFDGVAAPDWTQIPARDTGLKEGEPVRWASAGYSDALWGKARRELTAAEAQEGPPPLPAEAQPLPAPQASPLPADAALDEPQAESAGADEEPLPPAEVLEVQEFAAPAPPAPGTSSLGIAIGLAAAAIGAGGLVLLLLRRRGRSSAGKKGT